ncbi:hypothetical protein EON65_23695 [archaeon]|nr:MAG: hypothetical protein EON65_23695 [archaeon]
MHKSVYSSPIVVNYAPVIPYSPGIIACSGHGECRNNPTYTCECSDGWTGADCSERVCPKDLAWFGLPEADNKAHLATYLECSGVGLCDRSTGMCSCNLGFTGSACSRLACPGINADTPEGCNGHGRCVDMYTLAKINTKNGVLQNYTYGTIPNNPHTWDANRVFGCECDEGYEGYDCSLNTCPTGDDPLTRGQYDEQQILSCTDSDAEGSIVLTFRDAVTTPLLPTATTQQVKRALEALTTIEEVVVETVDPSATDSLCTTSGNQFIITFLTERGNLPMITSVMQNIDSFTITEYAAGGKENFVCSGRGLCNHETGQCECFVGYGSSDGKGGAGSKRDCGYPQPIAGVSLAE